MKRAEAAVTTAIDNGILTVTVAGFAPFVCDPAALPDAIRDYAALHGIKQKLVDAAALSVVDGIRPTNKDKHDAIAGVWDSIQSGVWNRRAEGDGSGSDGLLVRALMAVTGQDRETVRETVAGWTKAEQSAMRSDPLIAPIIATMKLEKAGKVNTSSLLEALKAK